ncbi:MAG: hypothetical protein LJE70_18890 [Chromatiaceae bacterium]|nr:hypothetical protein [Chromatiaceae bacterium]
MNRKARINIARTGVIIAAAAALTVGSMLHFFTQSESPQFVLEPRDAPRVINRAGSRGFEVGTGWSTGDPKKAVAKALEMALQGKREQKPGFLILSPTAGSNVGAILREVRRLVGSEAKIYGGTSDARGVMTDKGYVTGAGSGYKEAREDIVQGRHGLSLMTVNTRQIDFGVGIAGLEAPGSGVAMTLAAVEEAVRSAGKRPGEKPSAILISPTVGLEHDVLKGIDEAGFGDVPLVGGSVGGPDGRAFANDLSTDTGVSIAVLYTDLPVGWAYEGGYDMLDKHSGVVTKMDGRRIVELDHKPAFEVYDQWMDGKVSQFLADKSQADRFRDFLSLHPLARLRTAPDGTNYTILSHPWAPNTDLITNGLNTTTDIKEGDRVYLSYGTWEILLNRLGSLPAKSRNTTSFGENTPVLMSLGYFCAGVLGTIPENERELIPTLINHANENAPFIGNISWGEQGQIPGVGNQHGNLTVGFLAIGGKSGDEE